MSKLSSKVKEHLILNEYPIRQAVIRKLKHQNSVFLEELSVEFGRAKIDLVEINSRLHGIELKSDGDTLNRLHNQMKCYSSTFEHVTLIVGYSHLFEVIEMIPPWWGIIVVEQNEDGLLQFDQIRDNCLNPNLSSSSILRLLNWNEAYAFAKANNLKVPKTISIDQLLEKIENSTLIDQILQYTKSVLANRNQLNHASA